MQSFAEQLNAVRKQRNITQEQLAERMNVSRTTISRWESGKIMPDLDTIRLLSQLLDYNFFSYEDTPAEEPAEAPAPESEELPAPKPKKHRIWLLIAIVVCIAVACAALIPRFLSKPEANVNAFSLSTVAYLETDEEIGDCWRVTFAFQNESDVPFTPDHVVVLFYENDRIDDKIQMSYDEIRPWMDGDTLRKDDSPLHLLFTTNHLYYTRMECVMYGADANGHELQFRTSVKLSQEYATKPVKAEDQFGTLAEYIRAHESAKPEPGKAFLNVYTAVNPVKPVISEEFENRPMWIYDIQVAETNGVDFTVTDVQLIYFGDAWHIDRFDYTPERLDWPSDTIAAYKTASLTCGLPVQTMEGVGVSVFGKDANGNSMTFYGYARYKALYPHEYEGPRFDWPDYAPVNQTPEQVRHGRLEYAALLSMCDHSLGEVLDLFDEKNLWEDTMLIVCTDHGYMLGEHGFWAKNYMPPYEEVVHTPLFIWDPRARVMGEKRKSLVQTIDIPATLLGFFGVKQPKDMQGHDLIDTIKTDAPVRDAALFGWFGRHVCITDGRYVYMRPPKPGNRPLHEYTLMPMHMAWLYSPEELRTMQRAEPFAFTKGCPVMRMDSNAPDILSDPNAGGEMLFDVQNDPHQQHPIENPEVLARLEKRMIQLMQENDAPKEQYERMNLTEKM